MTQGKGGNEGGNEERVRGSNESKEDKKKETGLDGAGYGVWERRDKG